MATATKKTVTKKKTTAKNPMKCWEGYERVPGTKAGTKGSCRPKKQT